MPSITEQSRHQNAAKPQSLARKSRTVVALLVTPRQLSTMVDTAVMLVLAVVAAVVVAAVVVEAEEVVVVAEEVAEAVEEVEADVEDARVESRNHPTLRRPQT